MYRFFLLAALLVIGGAGRVSADAVSFCDCEAHSSQGFADCSAGYADGRAGSPAKVGGSSDYVAGYQGGLVNASPGGTCSGGTGTGTGTGTTGGGTGTGTTGTTGGGTTPACDGAASGLYGGPTPCNYHAASLLYHANTGALWTVLIVALLGLLGVWQGPRLVKWMVKSFADTKAFNDRYDATMAAAEARQSEHDAGYYDGDGNWYDNEKDRDLSESAEGRAWRESGSAFN